MDFLKRYVMNILRWLDAGLNVLVFFGDANEMTSSHAGKEQRKGVLWACVLCKGIDWVIGLFGRPPGHCARSINSDDGANATVPD